MEQSQPDHFYGLLAADAVAQVRRYAELTGRRVVDVGGGAGYFTLAFRRAGARCFLVERGRDELEWRGDPVPGAVLGDGYRLPVADASVEVAFSSNVLEHVSDPWRLTDEMVRITRPGGIVYLSFTNWYSPWGGHETSPWHYLGGERAALRYARRHGAPPGNRFGQSLFPLHVGEAMRTVRARGDVDVVDLLPRYYPRWSRAILRLPGVREVLTWNLLMVLRRR